MPAIHSSDVAALLWSISYTAIHRLWFRLSSRACNEVSSSRLLYLISCQLGSCQNYYGPFWDTLNNRCRNKDPKRDHNFDNHPIGFLSTKKYVGEGLGLGLREFINGFRV